MRIQSRSEEETRAVAAALLPALGTGDCLCLSGPVGAGKSLFARALIQAQMQADGQVEDVPSPTFTLVQTYETGRGEIWHADLYRLTHLDALHELGLEDAFDNAITLVEWPERLGPLMPLRRLDIHFSAGTDAETREIVMTPHGPGWEAALDRLGRLDPHGDGPGRAAALSGPQWRKQ